MAASKAIWRKTGRELANAGRILREQSLLKWGFVACFAAACEVGLWYLFVDGFRYLDLFGGFGGLILGRLFSLFFLGLGAMLTVSSLVTTYATVYRSRETAFLMTRPVTISQIVVYKFIEATALSSWAYFFVIVPFVAAYAWYEKISPLFAVWTLLFSVPFLILCSGLGMLGSMVFVRWFPGGRLRRVAGWIAGAAVVVTAAWLASRRSAMPADDAQFALSRLIPGMVLASNVLVPSSWMAEGIVAVANGQWFRGAMMWGTLASTALVVFAAVEWLGSAVFYESWQRATASGSDRRRAPVLFAWLDRLLECAPRDVRALMLKDVRTFFRDPMQWSQALVFFGLLGLYFMNLRTYDYRILGGQWRSLMVFLNVFSVSAVVCSLGSRFVYPQLSLEGQEFWLLGLSPTTMKRILMTKFALAAGSLLTVSSVLIWISSSRLQASPLALAVSVSLVAAIALAVCALSTGLGAVFIDLRQRNPAAIVSGFGGTLNLVLSLGFMLGVILPFAAAFHLHTSGRITAAEFRQGLWLAAGWGAALTAITTVIPLRLGARALHRRDF